MMKKYIIKLFTLFLLIYCIFLIPVGSAYAEDSANGYVPSTGPTSKATSNISKTAGVCAMDEMSKMYLEGDDVDKYCWYCKIVIVLVNAYLDSASKALATTISLAKMILKLGFPIWLAYYVLQQVSSMNTITMGKMLQEILVMGFKVAVAYVGINMGLELIRDYYLNPIVGTGVDYGLALFKGLNVSHGTGG